MTYSKLGNIKGPQGRRGLNMTGGATTPPAVGEDVLEGDLWLDSVTGDVYRATPIDPWAKDGSWRTWGTVLWKVVDDVLMVQPAEGDTGTLGTTSVWSDDGWGNSSSNPSMESITSVRSKGRIAMDANNICLFYDYSSLTDISALSGWDISGVTSLEGMFSNCFALADISPISGWDISGVTSLETMFYNCDSLTDASILSGWNMSGVTNMTSMFSDCPLERIGVPSLEHGGKNFVSNLKSAEAVTNMDTTMLTNTTTHETMSANQMLTDMDSTPSKYAAGTVWTL